MSKPIRRQLTGTAAALAIATTLAACGTAASPRGELARDKQILSSCDHARPPASLVELDVSGSSRSKTITDQRMTAIESIARTTAICGGHLRVAVFASSSAATTALYDAPLHLDGATTNARLKRVPRVVDETMTTIRQAYGPAVNSTPDTASDITSVYRLGAEWTDQLGGNLRLHLYVLTDGFQTVGVHLGGRAFSTQQATELAAKTSVPTLTGAAITVAGLGRIAGSPPPSAVVEGLVAYYNALCHKAGATSCTSVTDYAAAGAR